MSDLLQFDEFLFFFINRDLSNPFFDWIMPLLRNRYFWIPLYLFLTIFFVRNYGKLGWSLLLFFGLTFAVTDYFTSSVIKPSVERLRPCNDPEIRSNVRILINCGSGFSFPSTHAANHFALAFFLISMFYTRWKLIFPLAFLWAASICFAQIYVGVHYPIDVLFGALVGGMIGYVMAAILKITLPFRKWKTGN
ncbi:phosphatase PAP2 family protein [Daejeonella oryzae]|uniref:phosphatase PAP2 family protein n=1 Tax=Daejeonella oryzae TaxID=1122943 RepID=UPI0003F7BC77|nr:phosphatase PAP2 family protein [Daejeonella oryzae]